MAIRLRNKPEEASQEIDSPSTVSLKKQVHYYATLIKDLTLKLKHSEHHLQRTLTENKHLQNEIRNLRQQLNTARRTGRVAPSDDFGDF